MTNTTTNANARTNNAAARMLATPFGRVCLALAGLPINPKRLANRPQPQQPTKGFIHDANCHTHSNAISGK